jgi:hypothetical protein
MNANTIRARVTLSFQGQTYELDSVIDLEAVSHPPDFHRLLAQAARIDPYSYLYEVLESHEIEFSDATGLAARSCREGQFDWAQFDRDRRDEQDAQAALAAAQHILGGRDLEADTALKAALIAAYRAGKADAQR